jgi:hypothetical protein
VHASPVASLNKELDVSIHKWDSHGYSRTIRENEVGVLAEALNGVEDIVPSPTVEARRVVTELVDDLG